MNCTSCGAPLATDTLNCPFCQTRNAVDLIAIGDYRVVSAESNQQCPNQCGTLQQLFLGANLNINVGFCPHCTGLQFARADLYAAIEHIGRHVREINQGRLKAILAERVPREGVRYRPCASCNQLMHRRAYSERIPLLIDDCRSHGVWLDGGEFTVLAEWSEAGGLAHSAEQNRRDRRLIEPTAHLPDAVLQQVQIATAARPQRKIERIRNVGDIPDWVFLLIFILLLLFVCDFSWTLAGIIGFIIAAWLANRNTF